MKCIALHHQNYQTVSSANMLQIFTEYPVLGSPALIFSFIGLYNNIHTFNFSSKGKWINEEDIKKQNNPFTWTYLVCFLPLQFAERPSELAHWLLHSVCSRYWASVSTYTHNQTQQAFLCNNSVIISSCQCQCLTLIFVLAFCAAPASWPSRSCLNCSCFRYNSAFKSTSWNINKVDVS